MATHQVSDLCCRSDQMHLPLTLAVGPAHLFGRLACLPGSSTSPIPNIICNGADFSAPHIPPVLRMAMLVAVSCKKHTGVYQDDLNTLFKGVHTGTPAFWVALAVLPRHGLLQWSASRQ